jgi:hypothetical protein
MMYAMIDYARTIFPSIFVPLDWLLADPQQICQDEIETIDLSSEEEMR